MRYVTRQLAVEAVQWTGSNTEEIRAFAGTDFLFTEDGRVWVRNAAGPWELKLRDWISREDGKALIAHSEAAFARLWEPAGSA
jgi:hypothetical protein